MVSVSPGLESVLGHNRRMDERTEFPQLIA